MGRHEESWQGFQRWIDGKPALVLIDVGWTEEGPDSSRPCFVELSVPFQNVDENGMPSAEELESLHPLDQALGGAMERRFGAVCIAMMSGQGRRRWYYYSKSESGLGEAITAAASKWPAYPLAVKVQRDPRWEQLEKQLLPTAAEFRWNADLSVIQALEEAGDDMKTPRPIEHYAYFPDSTTRRQFVDWLRENDFELDELLVPNDDHPKPGVKFSRISTPELDEVYDQTCLASQGAEECGGDYDGWESQVVKGDL